MKRIGKRISQLVFIVCALLLIGTASYLTTVSEKEDISFYENRTLAKAPEWSIKGILSGEWGQEAESYLADHVAYRDDILQLDIYIKQQILKQPLIKNVVVTKDYLLPYIDNEMLDTSHIEKDLEEVAKNIDSVRDFTESYGGVYCYVSVPSQYVTHGDDYPWFMHNRDDYTAKTRQAFRARMAQDGILYVDAGESFAARGWPDELSSAIDNHNSIEGAYLTYRDIVDFLNTQRDVGFDVLEEGEYTTTTLPNPYLGSRIKALMGQWHSDEKLSIIEPNEPIPFTRKDYGLPSESIIYFLPENDVDGVEYKLYMNGDYASTEIDTNRPELPNVLIYGDSFTNAVECLLYTSCNKMWSLDMRYCDEGTLEEYITAYQPDVVICLRDYGAFLYAEDNGCGIKSITEN